jgi:LIM-domain binding protein
MAMAHLGPQQHMFQQQNPQMAGFPQMQMGGAQNVALKQQMMQRLAQQQQQQQQGGMPMGMQNHPNFNQAQIAAQMKMAGIPLQQQQQMHANQQLQNYQQAQAHQQRIMQVHAHAQAQQAQQQAAAMAVNQARQAQQMQLSRSQEQQTTQAPQPHPTPAPQNLAQPQQQTTPQGQPQPAPPKSQAPPQPATIQAQGPPAQAIKQNEMDDEPQIKQQDPGAVAMLQEIPKEPMMVGHSILQLVMFQDSLANPERPYDLSYWEEIIRKYFATYGSLKQQYFNSKTQSDKSFQLHFPSLARFYHAHFGSGIRQILLQSYDHLQNRIPDSGWCVTSSTASLTYVFNNDIRVTTQGALSVFFDASNKMVRFDLSTNGWQEYIPRSILLNPPSPDQKQSPKMNKNLKKVQQQAKQSNPGTNVPSAGVSEWGVPGRLIQFLEVSGGSTV